jgi:formylglycine-generating enzyme required for sulfatase activity
MSAPSDASRLQPHSATPAGEGTTPAAAVTTTRERGILLPDIDWVAIPGGEFIYQEGERRSLPPFRIARYPVTNVQFQTFIEAGGYQDERWWRI